VRPRTWCVASPLALAAALVSLAACAPDAPRAIAYGEERCRYCHMPVDDRRFAAEAATGTGTVEAFDAIECLAGWMESREGRTSRVKAAWVSDYARPGTLLGADTARFWRLADADRATRGSPMGKGFVATAAPTAPAPGAVGPLTWADVRATVAREGLGVGGHAH
jgi:hypothetical protein